MKKFSPYRFLLCGTALLILFAMPFTALAQKLPKAITVAVPQSPLALDPIVANSTSTQQSIFSVYDRLLYTSYTKAGNIELQPGLAESWRQIDDLTYEFVLRPGVRFHDGKTMTADDVVFSFGPERQEGFGGRSVAKQYFNSLKKVSVVDPLKVRFVLKHHDAAFLAKLGGWGAEIVSAKAFSEAGGWNGWSIKPIGTGPYKISEYRQDEILVLDVHDGYWGDRPPFSKIRLRVVPETSVRINGLLAGDFDMATLINPSHFDRIQSQNDFKVIGGPIQNIRTSAYITEGGVLSNLKIRQAISHAIDRQAIIDAIWNRQTRIPAGFQHPCIGNTYLEDIQVPAYDPDQARRLVKNAGYNGELIRYKSQTAAYPLELETSQIIVEMLRDVGLNVKLEVKENWSQVQEMPSGEVILNSSTLYAWPDQTGGLLRLWGPNGIFQKSPYSWVNQEFNDIYSKYGREKDISKRREMNRRLQAIYQVEESFGTVLFYQALFYAARTDLPWGPTPALHMDFSAKNPGVQEN
ncbi:MAG: ABC transporter substrate-binding protein [Desulfobacterales bacterium]|nr:ABC transporter substrate-binding protein [Desulfobacterales bacterium]